MFIYSTSGAEIYRHVVEVHFSVQLFFENDFWLFVSSVGPDSDLHMSSNANDVLFI